MIQDKIYPQFFLNLSILIPQHITVMYHDELNEYLECTCGRCDDGRCRCTITYDDDYTNEPSPADEINYDEYIDNLNDWD